MRRPGQCSKSARRPAAPRGRPALARRPRSKRRRAATIGVALAGTAASTPCPRPRAGAAARRRVHRAAVPRCPRAVRDRRHRHLRAGPRDGRFVGFTANSFNSVSLDPPLVLWSLTRRSTSLAAFETAERYAINVLAHDQVELARRFSRPHADRFEGVDLPARLGRRAADRRLRRVVRVPPPRAASRRRSRAVHRRGGDLRARQTAQASCSITAASARDADPLDQGSSVRSATTGARPP